jgi:phenylacetate-CoA ligase
VPIVEAAAVAMVHRAAVDSDFYRWFYAQRGVCLADVTDLASLRKLVPTVTKRDFLEYQNLNSDIPDNARQIHLTSGTSGIGREVHVRTQADLASLGTGGAYEYLWAGLRAGDRIMLTIPYSQTMAGPYFQASCEAAGLVPINAFSGTAADRIQQLVRFQCAGMSITPSYLHRMTVEARRLGFNPVKELASLSALFVSGEPYGTEWGARIEEFWGARLFEGWGATQTLGVVMASCEAGAIRRSATDGPTRGVLHALDHRILIEVLDDDGEPVEPGERGEIVVTTLRTDGLPCIRFRMGDSIRLLAHDACDCGRPFTAYEPGSIGRVDDMIKIKGMNVWPSAIDAIVLRPPVIDYVGRVFTDASGREGVRVQAEVPNESAHRHPRLAEELKHEIKTAVGIAMDVELLPAGTIPVQDFKSRRWTDDRAVRES